MLREAIFLRVRARLPKAVVGKIIGEILLEREVLGIVVRIEVIAAVVQFLHELCRSIAEVKGNRRIARLFDKLQGSVDGVVSTVRLGRGGQINGGFGEGNTPFGPSDFIDRIESGIGKE